MREVSIIGIGQTPVDEHWHKSLRHLAGEAVLAALQDAGLRDGASMPSPVDALYVGNMLSGEIAAQEHLGALIADFVGLRGIEACKVEAACCSGAAALRIGYMTVAGGLHDMVIACGVEKMTDVPGHDTTAALALAGDVDYEAAMGPSFAAINALLMRRYMHEHGVGHQDFAPFSVNAHRNGAGNPHAMFQRPITAQAFARAPMVADPISLLDSSPIADGAAAVVLCPTAQAGDFSDHVVRIRASAAATDSVALHDRRDPLFLSAAYQSARKAYQQAGIRPEDLDLFELHDAFTIMAALSLEACGFAGRGKGVRLAQEGEITLEGRIPICTMGGLKARGHPVGATGLYQVVEMVQQLRGEAGHNQVEGASLGMTQNIGGSGATVITHILETVGIAPRGR
jgi:acetyl-CoA C-acetyltransferase